MQGQSDEIAFAQFNQDGTRIITLSQDGRTARVWAVGSDLPLAVFEETGLQFSVFKVGEGYSIPAFSPDANRVVPASGSQPARVIGISPGRQPASFTHWTIVVNSSLMRSSVRMVRAFSRSPRINPQGSGMPPMVVPWDRLSHSKKRG